MIEIKETVKTNKGSRRRIEEAKTMDAYLKKQKADKLRGKIFGLIGRHEVRMQFAELEGKYDIALREARRVIRLQDYVRWVSVAGERYWGKHLENIADLVRRDYQRGLIGE